MKLFKPKLSTILYPLSVILYPLSVILSLFAAGAAWGDDCSTWSQVSDALENGRGVTLTADIVQDTATPCTNSSAADVTLDLNGHTLTRYAGDVRLIVIYGTDATLTVKGEGVVDGTADGLTQDGGCFYVDGGKLILESGTLKGKAPNGGAVAVSGSGVFEMKGGAITGSSATTKYGGGVYMDGKGARIVISGGEISGCTANQGGGVAVYRGSVSFSGGTVTNCTAKNVSDYGAGGGFLLRHNATLSMSGGTITHCQCSDWGGGVFFYGGGTISGGTIEYCRSDNYGGAIEYQGYDTGRALTISGGVFRGNSAYYSGGAFYTSDYYAPYATISGGRFVDNWTDKGQGDTIYVSSGTLTVRGGVFKPWNGEYAVAESGSAAIAGSSLTVVGANVKLYGDQVVRGTLTFDPLAAEYADIPLVDTNRSTVVKGESTWTVDTPGFCWTWEEVRASLAGGTNVTLMADIVQDTATPCNISSAADVTLDLNGHTLTRYAGDVQLIVIDCADATLTVKGEGVVDGTADGLTQDGGCFYVNDGKLILESGTLKGKAKYGGAVAVDGSSAAFEMRGGKITGSAATGSEKRGGGVYVAEGRFVMSGGSIESNSTDGSGGGVYVLYGSVEVIDGSFRNNSARYGGAIYEYQGSASIKGGFFVGNSATYADSDNLYLDQNVTVSGGVFEDGLKSTGVVYSSGYAAAAGTTRTVVGKDVKLLDDQVILGTLTFDPLAAEYAALPLVDTNRSTVVKGDTTWTVDTPGACWTWEAVRAALAGGTNVTLMADVVQDTATPCTISSAVNVTLDLNGHTLMRYAGDAQLIVTDCADATLTVKGEGVVDGTSDGLTQNGGCFSVAAGKLVLESGTLKGKAPNGGAVAVSGSGVFEMRGGAIEGSSSGSNGGGAYCEGGGGIVVYGGTFRDNVAGGYGGAVYGHYSPVSVRGGRFTGNTDGGSVGDVLYGQDLTLSGGVFTNGFRAYQVQYPSGYDSATGVTYTVVGKDVKLYGDQVVRGTLTFDPLAAEYADIPLVDTNRSTVVKGDSTWTVDTPGFCWTWDEVRASLAGGTNVTLMADVVQDTATPCTISSAVNVTLDLNGHTLTRYAGDAQLIVIDCADATLTVKGEGVVDGTADGLTQDGGCFYVNDGKLVLESGTLKGKAKYGGAVAVYRSSAAFEMRGGKITGSTATGSEKRGGGVYVVSGRFIMSGGSIESNSTDGYGGGVHVLYGSVEVIDGAFLNNGACYGGAIFEYHGSVSIKGGFFAGNSATYADSNNLYLDQDVTVSGGVFEGGLKSTGVVYPSGYAAAAGTTRTVVGKDVKLLDDQVILGTLTFDPLAAEYAALPLVDTNHSTVVKDDTTWTVDTPGFCTTWEKVRASLAGGTDVTLMADVVQDAATPCEITVAADVTLDLNGHTLTRKASTQLIVLNSADATLTVTGGGAIDGTVDDLSTDGGCFRVNAGTLVLESGTLKGTATWGGAVSIHGNGVFRMNGGMICDSVATANDGGGVVVFGSGLFEMCGGSISNCAAAFHGGGVLVRESGRFVMTGGTIESSASNRGGKSGNGGAICAKDGGRAEVLDGIIRNSGDNAIYAGNASLVIKGGVFSGNYGSPADVCAKSSSFTLSGGVFKNGLGVSGASYPSGYASKTGKNYTIVGKDLVLNDDQIVSGTLTFDPQGEAYADLNLIDTDETTVTQSGDTWVVYTANPIEYVECSDWASLKEHLVAGDSVKMMNDIKQDSGGTAYLNCGWSQTLNLNGHTLTRAAGVWLIVPNVAGNVLTVKGGGTVDGKTNSLGEGGGCFHVQAGGLVIKDGTFKGQCSKNGGAINVCSGASCEMRGGTITSSTASGHGGGVHVDTGGTFTMTGGTIEKCTASSDGGGIYTIGTTTLSDCTISGNTGRYGGGLYSRGGTISMTRVTVDGNTATTLGGGVGTDGGVTMTLDDCTISKNTLTSGNYGGGGLCIYDSTVEMRSGTISDNSAKDSTETTEWERSGGGVRLRDDSTLFILSGGTIKNNKGYNGGGVSVTGNAHFMMTGGTISGNEATKDGGGGIAIQEGGEAVVTGGEIINNTAKRYGGAVRADGAFQMSYGVVEGNTAASGGASIDFRKTASHSISGGVVFGSVSDNGAVTPITGGVYDNDVSKLVNTSAGWKSFACNGKYVIAQNNVSSANKFSTKDNKIYTGVFGFNVSDSIYSDHGVSLDPSRFITQGTDGLWYITQPPSIYVNGAPINDGSGTGWKLANGIVTLSSAMTYTITGASQGTDIGFVVSANAVIEPSSLTLTLGSQASVAPFHFTSGASAAKLNLTGDNTVYALGGHSAVEIDSGASVTLEGDGSLIGSGETSGSRGIYVAGTLKMTDGLITLYNTTQDGGAVSVDAGGTFDWTGGDITLCTGGNGGVLCNAGTATLTNAVLTGNAASGGGGAVYSSGTLTVGNSRFESNEASGNGGAISIAGGTATVLSSSFRKNQADGSGGAISCAGNLTMLNSTLIQCKSKSTDAGGGGVYFEGGSSKLANVTIRANSSAGYGGGIYAYGGSLSFVNVLLQGNTASVSSSSGDFCEDGAAVQAWGVLAEKTNLSGGEGCCFNETGCGWTSLFTTGPGESKYTVGETWQYVEELYRTTSNKALNGYDGSEYWTDITGRSFDTCQIGSYWTVVDKASLTVDSLDDVADDSDGFITLRDILEGLVDGDESYTSLAEGGVYKITFRPDLAGTLKMKMRQYEIANLDGTVVEIDGSTAAGGRLALQGYSKLTTNKTTKAVTTNSFRAFTVWQGNTLKIKNIDFTDNVGQKVSAVGTETNDGGAIANRGTLEAEGCTFTRCAAGPSFASPSGFGGAIANGQGVKGATATMSRCTFTACRAAQGGAVYNFTSNSVVFTDCAFVSNRAGDGKSSVYGANGGAIRNASGGELSYEGTTFTDNTAVIDGVDKPSDINDEVLNTPAVAVSVAKGVMSVALCAKAAPSLTAVAAGEAAAAEEPVIDMSGEATMKDESGATVPAVAIKPANVQPYLYYGLGRSETPDGEYKVSEWVQAGADGRLPESLKSPKTGESGFYRVEVSISGK